MGFPFFPAFINIIYTFTEDNKIEASFTEEDSGFLDLMAAGSGGRDLSLRCESISMPGQNVRSVPDSLRFGPEREQAQGMTYGPISATFISDRLQVRKHFLKSGNIMLSILIHGNPNIIMTIKVILRY